MLNVGLTGGIASGKSAVSGFLRELGAYIIDADAIAREVMEPGQPAYGETVRLFGKRITGSDGRIDRRALGGIVFRDADKRALLEGIVHPRVFEREAKIRRGIRAKDPGAVVVFDAALLIETGAYRRMDRVVVVWCSLDTQVERLMRHCGLSREEAVLRIGSQMPLEEKKRYATHIITNEGSLDDTRRQTVELYRELTHKN